MNVKVATLPTRGLVMPAHRQRAGCRCMLCMLQLLDAALINQDDSR
jgi:hypothetical protein